MTKYAISEEGIEGLEQLREDLIRTVVEIDEAAAKLYESIESIDQLGVYEKDILECVKRTIELNNKAKEPVARIAGVDIPQRIVDIEELMSLLGEGSTGSDGDDPPRKRLVLKR